MYNKNRLKPIFSPFLTWFLIPMLDLAPSPFLVAELRLWVLQSVTPLLREKQSLLKDSYKWIRYWLPCNALMLLCNFAPTRSFFKLIRLCYTQTIVNKHCVTLSEFLNLYTCQIHNLKIKQKWAAHHLRKAQFENVFRNYTHRQEYFMMLITKMKYF
jgi:hypothetical protein